MQKLQGHYRQSLDESFDGLALAGSSHAKAEKALVRKAATTTSAPKVSLLVSLICRKKPYCAH